MLLHSNTDIHFIKHKYVQTNNKKYIQFTVNRVYDYCLFLAHFQHNVLAEHNSASHKSRCSKSTMKTLKTQSGPVQS